MASLTDEEAALLLALALGSYLAARGLAALQRRKSGARSAERQKGGRAKPHPKTERERRRIPRAALVAAMAAVACVAAVLIHMNANPAIPRELVEFARKYPEAAGFAEDYPAKHALNPAIDLTSQLRPGAIPLFIQWDERWGYRSYGNSLLGVNGCGPTCLSMVVCGLTGDAQADPYTVARYAEERGYYVPGVGTSWDLMTAGAAHFGISTAQQDPSEAGILEALGALRPVICSMYPGDFTYTGHFIVLTGVDEGGDILLNDPNSPVHSARAWSLDELLPQIRQMWVCSLA